MPATKFLWVFVRKSAFVLYMADSKIRVIKSLDNLTEDLKDLLRKQYPNGYESSISRIINAKKEPIFVFPLETDNSIILVKVPATKNSDGGYDVESEAEPGFDGEEGGNDYEGSGDDNYNDDDYESGNKSDGDEEASYDPDFDD